MPVIIFSIKTRNKSFNLLQQLHKDFGVIFHPKTTVTAVENFMKEKLNGQTATEASGQVRQGNSERTRLVEKAKEAEAKQTTLSLEEAPPKASSSFRLKREDR